MFVAIPEVNETGSNQHRFDRVHQTLGNIEKKPHIDADCKKDKGSNVGDIRSFEI